MRLRAGREKSPLPEEDEQLLAHASEADRRIVARALPYSMIGVPRMLAVVDAVRYCAERGIPGAFVECGVWRGGAVLAMILTLQALGAADREIFLYDTFEGMTEPSDLDASEYGGRAQCEWERARRMGRRPWERLFGPESFSQAGVRSLLLETGYPPERIHFVVGPVEQTLPATRPQSLALLRLDTDWHQSTRHELLHLFPRLQPGGVLIVDDYGHWEGARRAVDDYFRTEHPLLLLCRTDYTGRIAIKY